MVQGHRQSRGGGKGDRARHDQAVADYYTRFLSVALDERAVVAVVTWGVSDRYTWLTPGFKAGQPLPLRDPSRRPLPFDAEFQPKPAFHALLNALKNAPMRSA